MSNSNLYCVLLSVSGMIFLVVYSYYSRKKLEKLYKNNDNLLVNMSLIENYEDINVKFDNKVLSEKEIKEKSKVPYKIEPKQ